MLDSLTIIDQRRPTHSPLATCGKWPFKCGEWLYFQTSQNLDVLGKRTQNSRYLIFIYTFNLSKCQNGVKTHGSGLQYLLTSLVSRIMFATLNAILVKS